MNVETGKLVTAARLLEMGMDERKKHVLVMRDLTSKEEGEMQIRLYAPCGCGSGKKFKFCCFKPGK